MFSRGIFRLLTVYQAIIYAALLLFFCGIISSWGKWYSASPYYREQVDAFLHGDLALSHNPADLRMDLCWSEKGVQQVWGLGIPLWELPFDVWAQALGYSTFPERIALGCFLALIAYVVWQTWFGVSASAVEQKKCFPSIPTAVGAVILLLFFAPAINLLRGPMNHYEEAVVYLYYFGILLACSLIALARSPTRRRFWLLCALSGIGGLIRPTLVFYGFATFAIASLCMFRHNLPSFNQGTKISRCGKFFRNSGFFPGLILFLCGGGLLFTTNYLRFGSGWEFGHRLNASPALPSIYSTRFDYPFKHVPLLEAARELFGMLFLTNHFNGVDWYGQGIFPWQSHTIRKHGIDMTTYDLSYAVLLAMAWVVGIWLFGRRLRSIAWNRTAAQRAGNLQIPSYLVIILWSIVATSLLAIFYLYVPVISDRYMLDFGPAFASSLAGLWWWGAEKISGRAKFSKQIITVLLIAIAGWQGLEIARGKNVFGSPQSITMRELQRAELHPFPPTLPDQYKIGDSMKSWGIPYNGEGWGSTNGAALCCAIFYVESPEFLDLELSAAPNSHATEASLTTIQAKVGREFLIRNSITPTNGGWILSFAQPRQLRYQKGLQPVFLAMVPQAQLAEYAILPSPWTLKRLSWRKK
jgi:hypothetical protein